MQYFDAHCHVQFPIYDEDRDAVLSEMEAKQVGGLVVGVDYSSSEKAIALVEGRNNLWASVGLHPNDTEKEDFNEAVFTKFLTHPKVVAIGECGLDNFRPENPDVTRAKQRDVFEKHVELAAVSGKPLMIHARPSKGAMDAYEEALDILERVKRSYPSLRGDFHFFVGDVPTARRIIELDFTLSYTAVLTFSHDYDEVVRFAPLTHLMSETDAPYVAPEGRRGKRNDPLAVQDVVSAMARIRGETEEAVREAVLSNAKSLFGI